jgi:hypothetical protein
MFMKLTLFRRVHKKVKVQGFQIDAVQNVQNSEHRQNNFYLFRNSEQRHQSLSTTRQIFTSFDPSSSQKSFPPTSEVLEDSYCTYKVKNICLGFGVQKSKKPQNWLNEPKNG